MLDAAAIRRQFLELGKAQGDGGRIYRTITDPSEPELRIEVAGREKVHRVLVPITQPADAVRAFPEWRLLVLSVQRQGDSEFLGIGLNGQDIEFLPVFCRLIEDLASAIRESTSGDERRMLLMQRLAHWHEFLRQKRHMGLSEEAQRGLFGELHFLREFLLPAMSPTAAIESWQGPDHRRHDFTRGQLAMEVKTTEVRRRGIVKISSEFQLDDHGVDALWLTAISVNTHTGDGLTLPALVRDVERRLGGQPAALQDFGRKLFLVGYLDEHAERYAGTGYEVVRVQWYAVGPDFPRIIPGKLAVRNVRYEIDLNQCADHLSKDHGAIMARFTA